MSAAKEMVELKHQLEILGWEVEVPQDVEQYIDNEAAVESKWAKVEGDLIRNHYKKIQTADAVLVANYQKRDIPNYIGGNSLMELAFGHVLDKAVYLLNPIPEGLSYSDEIAAMQPIILNGDLTKIL